MNKIAVGIGTYLGILGLAAGVIAPMIAELADVAEPLGIPPQTWIVVGAILGGLVIIGRMAQAVAITMRKPPEA